MQQPMSEWFWFSHDNQLMLSMGKQWQCTTAYGHKQIVDLPQKDLLFSVADSQCYLSIAEHLNDSAKQFSPAQVTHIAINATAAIQFHKPISPKSWYFDEVETFGFHHQLARVSNQFNTGSVFVLFEQGALATCMLLSEKLQLDEHKVLQQFELIKVAKSRLEPLMLENASQLTG